MTVKKKYLHQTISPFIEKYTVLSKVKNNNVVNSFESMKGLKTSILTNNSIYNYFKDNSKASLVPFDDMRSLLDKTGHKVIVLDKEVELKTHYFGNLLCNDLSYQAIFPTIFPTFIILII